MTIIDTTLYCNGALRLSRHGKGRGGNILLHVTTGEQITIPEAIIADVERYIALDISFGAGSAGIYEMAKQYTREWYKHGLTSA